METYHRVDAAAFGLVPNPAQLKSKRPLIRPDRSFMAWIEEEPCGVAGSFVTELTVPGGATLSAAAVSDVGVLATHRRRGVLTALMDTQLRDCLDRSESVAVLHASEGSIYRRFGYGPATRHRQVRIDARRTEFRSDRPVPAGSLSIREPAEVVEECSAVHDRVRRSVPGGLARDAPWWSVVSGDVESYLGGNPRHLAMLHLDADGRADGYALYEVHEDWTRHQPNHTLAVWELVGETLGVELSLWQALIDHDLVATVTGTIAADHGLWDVVVDPRQIGVQWEQDLLWVRVLDVPAVLSARTYAGSGALTIRIEDPLGLTDGTFRLEVDHGVGHCEPVSPRAAELTTSASVLGASVLGGMSWRRSHRANHVTESVSGSAALADRLFAVDPLPWCWVRF